MRYEAAGAIRVLGADSDFRRKIQARNRRVCDCVASTFKSATESAELFFVFRKISCCWDSRVITREILDNDAQDTILVFGGESSPKDEAVAQKGNTRDAPNGCSLMRFAQQMRYR